MTEIRGVLLLCTGFLYLIGNVYASNLDISKILLSGFPVNRTQKNSCIYTEVTPARDHPIISVSDGMDVLWKTTETGPMCTGVTLIESQGGKQAIMYIESTYRGNYSIKYFNRMGRIFLEANRATFNAKLAEMATLPQFDSELFDKEEAEEPLESGMEEERTPKVPGIEPDTRNFSDVVAEYESTEQILNRQRRSLRKKLDYQCDPGDRDCSHEKRILDIMKPEENKRVTVEYEVNDGVFAMTVTRRRRRVSKVYEEENMIWEGLDGARLLVLSCHSFFGEYRFCEIFYERNHSKFTEYYGKHVNDWEKITEREYELEYLQMKANIKLLGELALNISNVKNAEYFFEKTETNDRFKAYTYFPLAGYHLKKVVDGQNKIWSSDNSRCTAAIVVKEGNEIRYLKLELMTNADQTKTKFWRKMGTEYKMIDENQFKKLINLTAEEEKAQQTTLHVEDQKQQKPKKKKVETPKVKHEPVKEEAVGETQADNEFEVDYKTLYTEKKFGQKVDMKMYDGKIPITLDVEKPDMYNSDDNEYMGIPYLTFLPYEGEVFDEVKTSEEVIWQGGPGEYTDFVRVFYPGGTPAMAFLKIHQNGKELDEMYFIDDLDNWELVTLQEFKRKFDQHKVWAQTAGKHKQTEARMKMKMGGKMANNNLVEQLGNMEDEQPGDKPSSPMGFFVFDINDATETNN